MKKRGKLCFAKADKRGVRCHKTAADGRRQSRGGWENFMELSLSLRQKHGHRNAHTERTFTYPGLGESKVRQTVSEFSKFCHPAHQRQVFQYSEPKCTGSVSPVSYARKDWGGGQCFSVISENTELHARQSNQAIFFHHKSQHK